MTNELTLTNQTLELVNTKQELEIFKLKLELQKIQAEKVSRLEDSLFSPTLMPHYQKVAETLAKSTIIPTNYRNKPEDIFVAISMGYQLGFPVEQSLQDIAVINGKPCLWGDGLLALVLNHPSYEWHKEEPIYSGQTITGYIFTIKRKGNDPHSQTFTFDDAKKAGLFGKQGPWTNFPQRMLQMRARSWALRDKFADAMRGLSIKEEQEDIETIEAELVKPTINESKTQVDKLKVLLKEPSKIAEQKNELKIDHKEPITPDQFIELEELMQLKGFDNTRIDKMLAHFQAKSISALTQSQFEEAKLSLEWIK